jgi:hypothetical protein
VPDWKRVSWLAAEPGQLVREKNAMTRVAPELVWVDDDPAGGWEGVVPPWPFARPQPEQLEEFLAGRRLRIRIEYSQAHPMVEPVVRPIEPEPDPMYRTQHQWHVNGDGSLCLLQEAQDWSPTDTAADLVVKAAGWFLEYLLMEQGRLGAMTTNGIATDNSLDVLLTPELPDSEGGG